MVMEVQTLLVKSRMEANPGMSRIPVQVNRRDIASFRVPKNMWSAGPFGTVRGAVKLAPATVFKKVLLHTFMIDTTYVLAQLHWTLHEIINVS